MELRPWIERLDDLEDVKERLEKSVRMYERARARAEKAENALARVKMLTGALDRAVWNKPEPVIEEDESDYTNVTRRVEILEQLAAMVGLNEGAMDDRWGEVTELREELDALS